MAEPVTVDDLGPGDHACLTFTDPDERLDIVAAFVRDGLERGDKVLCLTDALTPDELEGVLVERGITPQEPLARGQLEVTTSAAAFVSSGAFDAERVIAALGRHMAEAQSAGYPGLRVTADMCWALRPVAGLEQLVEYESRFTRLLAGSGATAVCQYDRQCFDAVTLAGVSAAHSHAVAAVTYHHDPVLRICRQHIPPGVRLAGELDYRALEPLQNALGEAVRLDPHVFLNMTQLRFIDVAAAGAIVQTALGLGNGGRMTAVA
ncbi:MEDS domain-containing protein, partial [Virgisporangium aliadipatigenens]|uniref:MEDS domain-containing protein n=1 Tax=Virgisporangium aliadipatigenens TaxID=741659 RepID=UPI0019406D63